jgi:hypothetical protein
MAKEKHGLDNLGNYKSKCFQYQVQQIRFYYLVSISESVWGGELK